MSIGNDAFFTLTKDLAPTTNVALTVNESPVENGYLTENGTSSANDLLGLLRAAKSGENSAKAELCHRFLPLIRSASLKYRASGCVNSQDLLQEAHEAFLLCLEQFEEERGVGFAHFAKQRVYARLWTVVRREQTIQTRISSASPSFPDSRIRYDSSGSKSGSEFDLDPLALLRDPHADQQYLTTEYRLDLEPALLLLSERERIAVLALLEGRPLNELAPVYGVRVETVKSWRKRAFRKLRMHCSHLESNQ